MRNSILLMLVIVASGCATPQMAADYQTTLNLEVETDNSDDARRTASMLEERLNGADLPSSVIMKNQTEEGWKLELRTSERNASWVRKMLVRAEFNASYPVVVEDERYFNISEQHLMENTGDTVEVDSNSYTEGESFLLDNTTFTVKKTGDISVLEASLYENQGVIGIESSDVRQTPGGYRVQIGTLVSTDDAAKVRTLSENYESKGEFLRTSNGSALEMEINLAGRETRLRVSDVFRDTAVSRPTISFGADSRENAESIRKRTVAFLESGELPAEVKVLSIES